MRAIVSVLFVLVVLPGVVWAQPGQTPPAPAGPAPGDPNVAPPPVHPYPPPAPVQQPYPPPPGTHPYPPPGPIGVPYPYPAPPPVQLTPDEERLLATGEISSGQHVGGVVANWLFGFGIGQAIQGRWSDTGWIFTLGEAGAITLMIVGLTRIDFFCDSEFESSCNNNDDAGVMIVGGLLGYVGVHIWSIVDAATGPANHNRKVRALKRQVGIPVMASKRIIPYTTRPRDGGGIVGLTFRF